MSPEIFNEAALSIAAATHVLALRPWVRMAVPNLDSSKAESRVSVPDTYKFKKGP